MMLMPLARPGFSSLHAPDAASRLSHLSIHTLPPEQRLMLAVLEHAVNELQRAGQTHDARGKRLGAEARDWFASDDDSWPFSFVAICHALGIDVSYLRGGLERWEAARYRPASLRPREIGSIVLRRNAALVAG